jgi:hypothetical protein
MRGEFIGAWPEMWRHVWKKLAGHPDAPDDLFSELLLELNDALVERLDPATTLADLIATPQKARMAFQRTKAAALAGEAATVTFLERAHSVIEDFGSLALTNYYFRIVSLFVEKFSLRYELRRPFSLHTTLAGVFARLMRDLRATTMADAQLSALMGDFEEAVREMKQEQSPRRIRLCIQAQMSLLEAMAARNPGVNQNTLGRMCNEITSWPHPTVRSAMSNLYGFASDYPGIRHAGKADGALREIDMRDMVGMTIILAGFAPYLSPLLNSQTIYSE